MQAKAGRKQAIFVLLTALVLVAICTGGLWAYIQSADAKFGIQEAAAANLPQAENAFITREKYDSPPPVEETGDIDTWTGGFGLMYEEKGRLEKLQSEYADGKRPGSAAPTLPAETGFAILPLDPNGFGGMTEYYFLPETILTDEQLLQLIAYSAQKAETFTKDTLTVKNSTRGYSDYPMNRMYSARERDRVIRLARRCMEEGLTPDSKSAPAISLPVAGAAHIPLPPKADGSTQVFTIYPFREMTDEELLYQAYIDSIPLADEYAWLDATKEGFNPTEDKAWIRSVLEDVSKMPLSAVPTRNTYIRKEATGEIHLDGTFETALADGKKTRYYVAAKYPDRMLLTLMVTLEGPNSPGEDSVEMPEDEKVFNDPKWAEIARKTVERIDTTGIEKVEADTFMLGDAGRVPCIQYIVNMQDGGCYALAIRLSDGGINYILYAPVGPDPFEWLMANSW